MESTSCFVLPDAKRFDLGRVSLSRITPPPSWRPCILKAGLEVLQQRAQDFVAYRTSQNVENVFLKWYDVTAYKSKNDEMRNRRDDMLKTSLQNGKKKM